jgi:hypothetical protein
MNEVVKYNTSFNDLYTKSYRLAAAVFTISNIISEKEELRTRIKNLSLELVSMSVNLKDINFSNAPKQLGDIEKKSLELMSLLDIASLSGLISEMNGKILKEEFQSFILEINEFAKKFEDTRTVSVQNIFNDFPHSLNTDVAEANFNFRKNPNLTLNKEGGKGKEDGNGHKRKSLRKNTIYEFIKKNNNVGIKDIVPHIIGCSEKTVQRELIELIKEGKIGKVGERRWSKYRAIQS